MHRRLYAIALFLGALYLAAASMSAQAPQVLRRNETAYRVRLGDGCPVSWQIAHKVYTVFGGRWETIRVINEYRDGDRAITLLNKKSTFGYLDQSNAEKWHIVHPYRGTVMPLSPDALQKTYSLFTTFDREDLEPGQERFIQFSYETPDTGQVRYHAILLFIRALEAIEYNGVPRVKAWRIEVWQYTSRAPIAREDLEPSRVRELLRGNTIAEGFFLEGYIGAEGALRGAILQLNFRTRVNAKGGYGIIHFSAEK